ncbi:hypothetical protein Btru_013461 [Bulinus truncatus]|nr:hypothetical protein Btru_013461 [Bulinus truncatus]
MSRVTAIYTIKVKEATSSSNLTLSCPVASINSKISLLGYPDQLNFTPLSWGGIEINIPTIPANQMSCDWAWVIRMENLVNQQARVN